jgi:uncharacterized protein YdhG (YjbR/CyaY superfamily)
MAETSRPRKSGSRKDAARFTPEERAAMKERAQELRADARRGRRQTGADAESDVRAKIAEMPRADRILAERIHALVRETAPDLVPRTWYGMPAYAKDGKVVCFFQGAQKFKARYSTLGFNDAARLDDGNMWPTAFALTKLTTAEESKLRKLIKKAAK